MPKSAIIEQYLFVATRSYPTYTLFTNLLKRHLKQKYEPRFRSASCTSNVYYINSGNRFER